MRNILSMTVKAQIKKYIGSQPEPKCSDMEELHILMQEVMPKCKLWFLDGKDDKGQTVSNPNMGYGSYTIKYRDGTNREFYQLGLSANTTGISVYVMGLDDKTCLVKTYGGKIGKASVSGYCIKFKALKDINVELLQEALRFGVKATNEKR